METSQPPETSLQSDKTKPGADKRAQQRQTPAVRAAITIPLLLLAVLSVPFIVSDLDLTLHRPFYDADNRTWPVGEAPIWRFFYTFGPIPAILLGVVSIFTLLLGFGNPPLAKYRKLSSYFFFVLLIGSGLITNAILKDQWGRPRPKQITAFDGTEKFERLLHYEPESTGKSFPCGHATVGYFFLAFVPLLTGRRRWWLLAISLLFGTLIGIARITQGGHFTSDVIWAAAVMWFTSLLFYKLFKLDQSLWWQPKPGAKIPPKWLPWLSTPLVLAVVALATTIWPYDKTIGATPANLPTFAEGTQIHLDFNGEDIIEFQRGDKLTIQSFTDGHRAPKSRLRATSTYSASPPTITVDYRRQGFFSELNVRTVVTVPPGVEFSLEGDEELTRVIIPLDLKGIELDLADGTRVLEP